MDTIEETRKKRLALLLEEYGSMTKLADIIDPISDSQWENINGKISDKIQKNQDLDQ